MRIVTHAWADQRGFTFGEFLVSMAVLGLIMAGLLTVTMTGNQTYATGTKQVETQQAVRVALEQMVREIRGAGYNPTGAACPPVENCPLIGFGPTVLAIANDTNADGVFALTERIGYALFGTNLLRQDFAVDAAPQTIMGGIQTLTFTYLDQNDAVTTVPQDIRSVRISLTAQPASLATNSYATYRGGKVSVTMTDTIRLRNR